MKGDNKPSFRIISYRFSHSHSAFGESVWDVDGVNRRGKWKMERSEEMYEDFLNECITLAEERSRGLVNGHSVDNTIHGEVKISFGYPEKA